MATRDQVYIDIITEVKKSLSSLKKLGKQVLVVYAAYKTVKKIAEVALDAAQYAAKIDQIKKAFSSMAKAVGQDSDNIINKLSTMAGGTINKLGLLTSASRAALFKLPMDKMDTLMKIARASATATGESVKYMFDSIVLGIARGSPKILDNLGILIKAEQATIDYAASIGKTAEELTAAEKTQATMNAVLLAGQDIMEGVGKVGQEVTDVERWQILQAAVSDLKGELGKGLLPAFRETTKQATALVEKLTEIAKINRILKEVTFGTSTLQDELFLVNAQLAEWNATIEKSGAAAETMLQWVGDEIEALENRKKAIEDLIKRQEYQSALEEDIAAKRRKAIQEEQDQAAELQRYLKEVQDAYALTPEGQRAALAAEIAHWEKQLETANKTAPEIIAIIKSLKTEWDNLNKEVTKFADVEPTRLFRDAAISDLEDVEISTLKVSDATKDFVADLFSAANNAKNMTTALSDLDDMSQHLGTTQKDLLDIEIALSEWRRRNIQDIEDQKDAITELTKEQQKMASIATDAFIAFGQAFADAAVEGGNIFKEAMKAGVASAVQAIGMLAMAHAGYAFASLNFVKAAALFGAGVAAFAAAAGIRALAEGGIVTQPTTALIGERGPEAVIPLGKAGAIGGITINVHGSLIAQENLLQMVESRVWGRFTRVY